MDNITDMTTITTNADLAGDTEYLKMIKRVQELEEKRNKQSPFSSYIQLLNDESAGLVGMILEKPVAAMIFLLLACYMDNKNECRCLQEVFMEVFKISNYTVYMAIQYLKSCNAIEIRKEGTSNIYILNPKIVWNSSWETVKFCRFKSKCGFKFSGKIVETIGEIKKTTNGRNHYIQISKKEILKIILLIRIYPKSTAILVTLAMNADKYNNAKCTIENLRKVFQCNFSTICRNLKYLMNSNAIQKTKEGVSNVYILNPLVFWTSWSINNSKCDFQNHSGILIPNEAETTMERIKLLKKTDGGVALKKWTKATKKP